jgi:hypothetical protein
VKLLDGFKNGTETKPGPQIDRNVSEGPLGRTCMHDPEVFHYTIDRDFEGARKEWETAKAEAAAKAAAQKK